MPKRPHYDKRMSPLENLKWKAWRPFLCWARSHDWFCARVVCTYPKPNYYFWWCRTCMEMEDHAETCGQCDNGCHDERPIVDWRTDAEREEDEGEEGEEGLEYA